MAEMRKCLAAIRIVATNVRSWPEQRKYRLLRKTNMHFADRIFRYEEAERLLTMVGFEPMSQINCETGNEEEYLVLNTVNLDHVARLVHEIDALLSTIDWRQEGLSVNRNRPESCQF